MALASRQHKKHVLKARWSAPKSMVKMESSPFALAEEVPRRYVVLKLDCHLETYTYLYYLNSSLTRSSL